MMKLTEVVKKYGDAELSAEQLKALGIEAEVDRFERCEEGEDYYFIGTGHIVDCTNEAMHWIDNILYEEGNYYPCKHWTEAEVRFIAAQKKKKAIAENKVNKRIKELNDGWVPNWKDSGECKWCICYKRDTATFMAEYTLVTDYNASVGYCKSCKVVEQIIEEMHEELKTVWGVE